MREPISGRGFWISNLRKHFDSDGLTSMHMEQDDCLRQYICLDIICRARHNQDWFALCWSEIPWRRAAQPSLQGRKERRREGGKEGRQEFRRLGGKKAGVEQNTVGTE